jgi:hypothetical protein
LRSHWRNQVINPISGHDRRKIDNASDARKEGIIE